VEKLLSLMAEGRRLVLELARLRKELDRLAQKEMDAVAAADEVKLEVRRLKVEISLKEKALEQMMLANRQLAKELQKMRAKAEADIAKLREKAGSTHGQTLTFSMETSTGGLRQYTICLKGGRLYRVGEDARMEMDDDRHGHIVFSGNGHAILGNPDETLGRLLKGVSPHQRYVVIWCDGDSYPVLVELRKYLRRRKILCRFSHNEEFGFVISDEPGKASL